ncbi:hypothetical protein D3C80_1959180 [compost metagenome]
MGVIARRGQFAVQGLQFLFDLLLASLGVDQLTFDRLQLALSLGLAFAGGLLFCRQLLHFRLCPDQLS